MNVDQAGDDDSAGPEKRTCRAVTDTYAQPGARFLRDRFGRAKFACGPSVYVSQSSPCLTPTESSPSPASPHNHPKETKHHDN